MRMKQQREAKQPCGGKARYESKAQAEKAMSLLRDMRGPGKRESRAYRCPKCHGWHLTSKGRRRK